MTVRDALTAAIAARFGAMHEISHATFPWHSATFSGEVHRFMFDVETLDGFALAAMRLSEDEIAIHSGFVADMDVTLPDPARPRHIRVETLVVSA